MPYPKRQCCGPGTTVKKLKGGFKYHIDEGLDNERYDCSTIDEKSDLRCALQELQDEFRLKFSNDIFHLEEEIEQLEERRKSGDSGGGGFSETTSPVQTYPVTEENVREMFRSLRSDD